MRAAWAAAVVVAGLAIAALWAPSRHHEGTRAPPPAPTATSADVAHETPPQSAPLAGPLVAVAPPGDADDVFEGRERVAQMVDRQDVAGLLAVDVTDGYAAAEAIAGLGTVGARQDPERKALVRARLSELLRAEARRDAPGASGNASIAVEALEGLGDPESARALAAALGDNVQPIYRRTMIVKALERMNFSEGSQQVKAYESYIGSFGAPHEDSFELELWKESMDACASALKSFEQGH